MLTGELSAIAGAVRSGVPWIDDHPDAHRVVARLSRSIGLPSWLPDIIGLALRVETGGRTADIEFASTGAGAVTRFMLLPGRSPSQVTFGILFPYESTRGPLLLCARTVDDTTLPAGGAALDEALAHRDWHLELCHATPAGAWHPFANLTLRLTPPGHDDPSLRFDAGINPLPDLATYPWVRALREPAYFLAQGSRTARAPRPGRSVTASVPK